MWEEYRLHRTPKLFEQVIYLKKIAHFCENVERVTILPHTKIIWTGTFFFRKNSTLLCKCGKTTDFTVHQNYLNRYIYLEKVALFCENVERVAILPYIKIIWTGKFIYL